VVEQDFSDFEVSPEERLKDYQALTVYPDESRPARGDAPPFRIEQWPGLQSKPQIDAARILGWNGETFRDGSLHVSLDVRVEKAGRYSFFTILRDAGGKQNLIESHRTRDLRPGTHTIEFLFYGRIFRDLARVDSGKYAELARGPYQLPGAFGERVLAGEEIAAMTQNPDDFSNPEGRLAPFYESYTTRAYDPGRFTDQPWDSAQKQQRIDALEAEIRAKQKAEQDK